jgi:hypothetical protein
MKAIKWILLLCALPVMASAENRLVDTLKLWDGAITAEAITANTIGLDAIGLTNAICDSAIISRVAWNTWDDGSWNDCHRPKDTTRWYIKAIGEKCDSTYKKIYAPTPENPQFFQQVYERTITCKTDTTWAEKVQVWLRPEQLEKLTELLK